MNKMIDIKADQFNHYTINITPTEWNYSRASFIDFILKIYLMRIGLLI